LLVLGRVSNLPTVWSNCLAAWLLAGGGAWPRFVGLGFGATLIYTGGMFLNDAFDVEFDRKHRPERPIIAGEVRAQFVWYSGLALLGLGWISVFRLGTTTPRLALILVAIVIAYNAVHKRTKLAPLLMAGCRFLLYLVAASTAVLGVSSVVIWRAVALLCYIIGLSYIARSESITRQTIRWPIPFLFLPIAVALGFGDPTDPRIWLPLLLLVAWIGWCISPLRGGQFFRKGVAGLLAGIPLVDLLAWRATSPVIALAFVCLFLLALLLQRIAPAT